MNALVGLEPASVAPWTVTLEMLPPPPALKYSGFLIRYDGHIPIEAVIDWVRRVQVERPHVPIALVNTGPPPALWPLNQGLQFTHVIKAQKFDGSRVPLDILECIRDHAVEGRLLAMWSAQWNLESAEADALAKAVAAVGARGGRLAALGRVLGCSRASLYRHCENAGLPPPGTFLAIARVDAVKIRVELGTRPAVARAAAGWFSATAYRKAHSRLMSETKRGRT